MFWQDLLLERTVDDQTLALALATAFGREPADVLIGDAVGTPGNPTDRGQPILVERWLVAGDFPLQVRVFLRNKTLEDQVYTTTGDEVMLARLCALLGMGCLYSDDSPDPHSELYMHPTGEIDAVTLDHDALDHDAYVVAVRQPSGRKAASAA